MDRRNNIDDEGNSIISYAIGYNNNSVFINYIIEDEDADEGNKFKIC